jgi:hypothetical protein
MNKNLSNIDEVVDTTIELINNPNQLLYYVGISPFGENRMQIIENNNNKIISVFKKK